MSGVNRHMDRMRTGVGNGSRNGGLSAEFAGNGVLADAKNDPTKHREAVSRMDQIIAAAAERAREAAERAREAASRSAVTEADSETPPTT